eukprot:CAMPEP_0194438960 /NCGR_PEP_ID=MMETSP0176-20130528/107725_1 /TAXON_ID=216777 /ORGANISM="Proboscia alata, Strain PI-D3" /LENGTH=74 /DNA_ID=CAMNT_0039261635 /DNA_START=143 /DNA_END=364 /DNA_ORIENTATION=+
MEEKRLLETLGTSVADTSTYETNFIETARFDAAPKLTCLHTDGTECNVADARTDECAIELPDLSSLVGNPRKHK